MTPAELAKSEDTDESEILERLDDPVFADLVEYYRDEQGLPEDERERLLIATALAELKFLADFGDMKAFLFLAYEENRGRRPENRLRQLTPRMTNRPPRLRAVWDFEREEAESLRAELLSGVAELVRSVPDMAGPIEASIETRPSLLGESRDEAEERTRREIEKKSTPP